MALAQQERLEQRPLVQQVVRKTPGVAANLRQSRPDAAQRVEPVRSARSVPQALARAARSAPVAEGAAATPRRRGLRLRAEQAARWVPPAT